MEFSILLLVISCVVIAVWNIFLTVVIFKMRKRYNNFFVSGKEDLYQLLTSVTNDNQKFHQRSEKVEQNLEKIANMMKKSFQKLGIIRYNPFQEIGGDMSFSLAILDMDNNGFVLTSIHGRGADRVYVKSIIKGKSRHNLSAEEVEAINKATEKVDIREKG